MPKNFIDWVIFDHLGTHAHANNLVEQTMATITPLEPVEVQVHVDVSNLAQNTTFRLKIEIDGAAAQTVEEISWVAGGVSFSFKDVKTGQEVTVTAQSGVVEGASKDIPVEVCNEGRNDPTVVIS